MVKNHQRMWLETVCVFIKEFLDLECPKREEAVSPFPDHDRVEPPARGQLLDERLVGGDECPRWAALP